MVEEYFSILWECRESYEEWNGIQQIDDGQSAIDLCLKNVYAEIQRLGGFGNRYDLEKIFLCPCTRLSTIQFRQNIMEQVYEDSLLYDLMSEYVSDHNDTQKRSSHINKIHDLQKKKIYFLQNIYKFLVDVEKFYVGIMGHVNGETLLSGELKGMKNLIKCIMDDEAMEKREKLAYCLSMLDQCIPHDIVLNKDMQQGCQSIVIRDHEGSVCGYTERLKELAGFFLEDYKFSIDVYQDVDITCLDKNILEYTGRHSMQLMHCIDVLYNEYKDFSFVPFSQLAYESVFYLSCVRFMKEYVNQGFYFVKPCMIKICQADVKAAYDMTLGMNLFRSGQGFRITPNDYTLCDEERFFILTGANQGGKTTFIRSIGLIQWLAQIGMFVPAQKAVLGVVKHIYTHFSRDEEMKSSVGRFEQELQRMHHILNGLTQGDMVLLNESFSSTQRVVAVALLKQLIMKFNDHLCIGGVVTHCYELFDELQDGYSMVAEIAGEGECRERTFKIVRKEPDYNSYARDIAAKCGVTYSLLTGIWGNDNV